MPALYDYLQGALTSLLVSSSSMIETSQHLGNGVLQDAREIQVFLVGRGANQAMNKAWATNEPLLADTSREKLEGAVLAALL